MSADKTFRLYEIWRESAEKLDYFMVGMSAAIVGYLAQSFRPTRVGWSPEILEFVAIIVLLASVAAGFKRIETTVHLLRLNHEKLFLAERKADYRGIIDQAISLVGKPEGRILTREELLGRVAQHEELSEALEGIIGKVKPRVSYWYVARNSLLILGLLMLLVSRLWGAYP